MNEINVILEGKEYKIDIQKAKELGILKEQNNKVKSWDEFCEKYMYKTGYYFDEAKRTINTIEEPIGLDEQLTKGEVEAMIAFSKLLKLRRDWIGYWEPDWTNSFEVKYCIERCKVEFEIQFYCEYSRIFSFPTKEMAQEFLECFKDLFEQCKNLI